MCECVLGGYSEGAVAVEDIWLHCRVIFSLKEEKNKKKTNFGVCSHTDEEHLSSDEAKCNIGSKKSFLKRFG